VGEREKFLSSFTTQVLRERFINVKIHASSSEVKFSRRSRHLFLAIVLDKAVIAHSICISLHSLFNHDSKEIECSEALTLLKLI